MRKRTQQTKILTDPTVITVDQVLGHETIKIITTGAIAPITLPTPSKPLGSHNDLAIVNDLSSTDPFVVNGSSDIQPGDAVLYRWAGFWVPLSGPALASIDGGAPAGGGPIALLQYNGSLDTILGKYNITSVTKIGTGTYDIQISVSDPADHRRFPNCSNSSGASRMFTEDSFGGGAYRIRAWDDAGLPVDTSLRWALWDVVGAVAVP